MVSEVRDGFSFMCFVVFFRIKTNALLSYHLLPVHPTLSIQYYHFVFLVTCQNEYIPSRHPPPHLTILKESKFSVLEVTLMFHPTSLLCSVLQMSV